MNMSSVAPALRAVGLTKRYPGVTALDDVDLDVHAGRILSLSGANGAGKSTLVKILSGAERPDAGRIWVDGIEVHLTSPHAARRAGIYTIYQELSLVPSMSVVENIFLDEFAGGLFVRRSKLERQAEALMERLGVDVDVRAAVNTLPLAKQQLVEIAKALSKEVNLLILDEPTSSLNENDSRALLDLLREFRSKGITSILISHKLNEVESVADTITILRDGKTIESLHASTGEISEDRIIRGMVGRELVQRFPDRDVPIGEVIFEVKGWNVAHPIYDDRMVIKDVSLNVRAGEVVGIAGLMGAGRTEFAMSVFGRSWGQYVSGSVAIKGREVDVSTIPKAVKNGLAYVTEDRKTYGLVLINDVKRNITLANLPGVSTASVLNEPKEVTVANGYRDRLAIKCSSVQQETVNLSGGNQQKVVLSKWLFADPDVLILDEPTRGIDVGAKYEIYTIINRLAAEGKAVIIISSELPEVLGVADRIYVMAAGQIAAEMPVQEASQESIMRAIMRLNRAGVEEVVL